MITILTVSLPPSFLPRLFFPTAGSTYTSETQYGLGGTGFSSGAAGSDYITSVNLHAYVVITSVTCVYRPDTIVSTFSKIYGGSGRFAKFPASKVASVKQDTLLMTVAPGASNPINPFQFLPQEWETQLEVNYVKPYFHSSML